MKKRLGLQVKNISKQLDGKKILDNISFSIQPGKILALVGPSGSGKSTLLRTINRLIEIDSGAIILNGQSVFNIDPIELRRCAGMVFQIPTMFDGSVEQNIEFGLKLDKEYNDNSRKRIVQALKDSGISKAFLKKDARKLSVGEQQRIAIARALVLEPAVLLLDEPTASLDPKLTQKFEKTIIHLCKTRNLITLWVTHDHAQARRIGGALGILKNGKLKLLSNFNSNGKLSRGDK